MTLIGNGWLHESPRNVWPRGWDIKSRSAMRKCMFLPASPELARALPHPNVSPAALPARPAPGPPPEPAAPFRSKHPVQLIPAYGGQNVDAEVARRRAAFYADAQAKALAQAKQDRSVPRPGTWYEDPIALGTLLLLLPPVGLAALWSSKRYSNDARWALTVMTGLTLCVAAALAVAVLALRA